MKVAVMGAGAVGGYYGGLLARAGHEVVLIGRPAHVEAMQAHGLRLQTASFDERIAVQAGTEAAAAAGAELVLFCVKSTDTETAGAQLAPVLAPNAVVLSLQNGVDNAGRLARVLGRSVIPAVVYVATEMAGPGHVRHHGRGELVLADTPAARSLVEVFGAAGVPVQVSGQVDAALWSKLILNCAYNALSAITRRPYGELVQGEGVWQVMREVVDECLAVASAAGVAPLDDPWPAVERIARSMPGQFSSTAQDLLRGRPSEIDHLNGIVVREGARLGVATPANRVLLALVKLLETKAPPPAA